MRYALEVDEVVLRGFGTVDRQRLVAGLHEELTRLLARDGIPASISDRPRLDAGRVRIAAGDDHATGRNLARAVHAGLKA